MAYQPLAKVIDYLSSIFDAVQHLRTLSAVRGVANDIRVTNQGLTTVTGTVSVTGSSVTVSGITNIGGLPSTQLVGANQNTVAVLSNINNITL